MYFLSLAASILSVAFRSNNVCRLVGWSSLYCRCLFQRTSFLSFIYFKMISGKYWRFLSYSPIFFQSAFAILNKFFVKLVYFKNMDANCFYPGKQSAKLTGLLLSHFSINWICQPIFSHHKCSTHILNMKMVYMQIKCWLSIYIDECSGPYSLIISSS